jgi:rhodanese-related sulfurtransferase
MFLAVIDWVLPIVLGLLIGILLSTRKKHDFSQLHVMKAEEFAQGMRKGQLIDIRSDAAYQHIRINGSRHFERRSVLGNLSKFRKDQPVYLYDETLSTQVKNVAKSMIRKGFKPIYILDGGFEKWPYSVKAND